MNKKEIGKQLLSLLSKESDIVQISRWAFGIYSNFRQNLEPSLQEIL